MWVGIGIGVGRNRFASGGVPPFATDQWQLITQQWQSITTTWN